MIIIGLIGIIIGIIALIWSYSNYKQAKKYNDSIENQYLKKLKKKRKEYWKTQNRIKKNKK